MHHLVVGRGEGRIHSHVEHGSLNLELLVLLAVGERADGVILASVDVDDAALALCSARLGGRHLVRADGLGEEVSGW